MAKKGDQRSEADKGLQSFGEEEQTWARVVQGAPWGSTWMSHMISSEEIKHVQTYFSKVLELPESILDASRRQWEVLVIIIRSLG